MPLIFLLNYYGYFIYFRFCLNIRETIGLLESQEILASRLAIAGAGRKKARSSTERAMNRSDCQTGTWRVIPVWGLSRRCVRLSLCLSPVRNVTQAKIGLGHRCIDDG